MSRLLTANDPLYDAFLRDVLERSEIAACAEPALGALGDDLPHAPLPAGLRECIAAGLSTTGRLDRFAGRVAGLLDISSRRARHSCSTRRSPRSFWTQCLASVCMRSSEGGQSTTPCARS
jgi:hypothetical protein